MIPIPCGHCDECVALKQLYLIQRIQMESLVNHIFFCTITYNNDMMPVLETSLGYKIRYTDYRDITNMLKRIREDDAFGVPFRYLCVTERGSLHARPHAHLLFFIRKNPDDNFLTLMNLEHKLFDVVLKYWSRNVGSKRKPIYIPCCTYIRKFIRGKLKSTYDLHCVLPRDGSDSCSNVAFYVLKYMLKYSASDERLRIALKNNYTPEEFDQIWSKVRSRLCYSKGFGLSPEKYLSRKGIGSPDRTILEHIRKGVKSSVSSDLYDFPVYYNIDDGKSFPLSPYYKNRGDCYSLEDALSFYYRNPSALCDSPRDPNFLKLLHRSDVESYFSNSARIHRVAGELCDADSFDELFD